MGKNNTLFIGGNGSNAKMFRRADLAKYDIEAEKEQKELLAEQARAKAEQDLLHAHTEENCVFFSLVAGPPVVLYADSMKVGARGVVGFSPVINRGRMMLSFSQITAVTIMDGKASPAVREMFGKVGGEWIGFSGLHPYDPPELPRLPDPPVNLEGISVA